MRCPLVVGRDTELEVLARVADSAAAGMGATVLVAGEAGVGKTRLVLEAAARARQHGHRTLRGRSTPTDRSSPLRPVADALLDALRDEPPPVGDASLRPYLPALGTIVPHWAEPDGSVLPPVPVVLAEAVLRVLRWLAGNRAAVLVIEDLHWSDRETLAVLEYLADHVADAPIAVLLTVRSDEPTTSDVESIFRQATTIRLPPLLDGDVAAMAAACLGVPDAPAGLVERLRRAGGLPLVVEDLVDLGGPMVPLRYAEIVTRRLAGLDPAARRVVEATAVLGTEVDLELLATVIDDDGLGHATTAAAAGTVLRWTDGRLAFRHALTREQVLAELTPKHRRALSRAAAAALEESGDAAAPSERLGELWAQAGDPRRAAEAWRRAAQTARIAGATAAAQDLIRRAVAVAPPDLLGPLRLELLDLLAVAGHTRELAELGARSLDDLAHDPELTVSVHLLLARAAVAAGAPSDAQPHLDAVAGLGELTPRQWAQLRIVQGQAAMSGGSVNRLELTAHLAAQAVALAEQAGEAELTCEALELLAASRRIRDLTAAADALRRALAVADAAGLVLWRLRALNELGTVELLRDARTDRLQRAHELALRVGAVDTAASVAVNLAAAHAMTGAVEDALGAAEEATQLAAPLGINQVVAAATAIAGVAHGFAGRRREMERWLRRAAALSPDDADLAAFMHGAGRGVAALIQEERAQGVAAFEQARRLATPIRTLDTATGPLLLLRAVAGDDVRDAVEAELATATAGARWTATWLGYAHAVALGCAGDPAGADEAFDRAERAADRYPLFRAIALRLVAESAMSRGFGQPVRWLRDAEAELVRRGLHRIAGACRSLLVRAGAGATRRRGADASLPVELLRLGITAREAEVLDLVGARLANREIATRLYLSPRTVEKHVASLLQKTEAADRAELVRLASALG